MAMKVPPRRAHSGSYIDDGDECDGDSAGDPRVSLTSKLPFEYKGDVFSQRGSYVEASLYMSRLPPTRTTLPSRPRRGGGGGAYRLQGRLAPMPQPAPLLAPCRQAAQTEPSGCAGADTAAASVVSSKGSGLAGSHGSSGRRSATRSGRKQQYALAVAAMAANPALHAKLLDDGAILASLVSFGRSKDATTVGACVATLGHLSRQPEGRVAILNHSALALLVGLSLTLGTPAHAHTDESPPLGSALILQNCLATLANLTIEDGFEAAFVKEKGLESLLRHRKSSAFVEDACSMAVLNLSCPAYSYPRVDDVVAGAIDMATRDRALTATTGDQLTTVRLSRALFNLSSVKTNHAKLAEPDAVLALQLMIAQRHSREVRQNALAALWHLAAGSSACRRSIVRSCTGGMAGGCSSHCIAVVVDQLRRREAVTVRESDHLLCPLSILDCLARDEGARELMAHSHALDELATLAASLSSLIKDDPRTDGLHALILRLVALVLSLPANVGATTERVFQLLASFRHHGVEGSTDGALAATTRSRSVLLSLACILSWSGEVDPRATALTKETCIRGAGTGPRVAGGGGAVASTQRLQRRPSSPGSVDSVDDILDRPGRLESVYSHVSVSVFAPTSSEAYLQMALLYNLSFRYSKVDVALLAFPRLLVIAEQNRPADASALHERQRATLALVGGTVFNLCQEYQVHPMVATTSGLRLLRILLETAQGFNACRTADGGGESEIQRLALDTVCLLFDGRTVARTELVRIVSDLFPTLRGICSSQLPRQDAQVRAACAACLSRFATVTECRLLMIREGVLVSLSTLADSTGDDSHSSSECLRHCATTYALLASGAGDASLPIGPALVDGGIVKALMLLADAPEEAVRRLCATVLCNLSTSEHAVAAMVKSGALRALLVISCVKSNDPETRRICMKAVLNLLRREENVDQMCQEGLLWAFGLFFAAAGSASSGELTAADSRALYVEAGAAKTAGRDYDILADAFCALSYYPQSRSGLIKKPAMVASVLKMLPTSLSSAPSTPSRVSVRKIVSGVLNLLNETELSDRGDGAAPMLLRLGVVPAVLRLLDSLRYLSSDGADDADEVRVLAAQILTVVFQTPEYGAGAASTRLLLLRCIYNLTCDASIAGEAFAARILPALSALLPGESTTQLAQSAAIVAGALRNLSTRPECLETLTSDTATTLLREAFASGNYGARRNVALCTCNLFLGNINSHELLTRASLLPHVLWMCSSSANPLSIVRMPSGPTAETDTAMSASAFDASRASAEASMAALSSAVLRKLANAPGNMVELLDSGTPIHLASLMRSPSSNMFVKANCMATFCMLAQHPDAPALLASAGVISLTLEVLEQERYRAAETAGSASAPESAKWFAHFEAMCLELLSTLAAFASSEHPRESTIASTLLELMEKQESAGASCSTQSTPCSTWRSDRQFLARHEGGNLPPTRFSTKLQLPESEVPALRASLQPFSYQGHSVAFSYSPSYVEMRTIEPLVPDAALLKDSARSTPSKTLPEFTPPAMFMKVRTSLDTHSGANSDAKESDAEHPGSLVGLNNKRPGSSRGNMIR